MCGIAGFIDPKLTSTDAQQCLREMIERISHRGPDDCGTWVEGPVAIGHARLSIIDVSPLGHQPMVSPSGNLVISFNGEIYNHKTLRTQLEARGHRFAGHSDTEVLLALVEERGLEAALRECIGMFALAVWNRRDRTLQLARDRFGEKPLFYSWQAGVFLFGSELKALRAHKAFSAAVDRESLAELLRFGYVPAPHTIYRNVRKLRPGSILTLRVSQEPSRAVTSEACGARESAYWTHEAALLGGLERPLSGTYGDAVAELETLLIDAVSLQMQADVPLGAFLSGGIDSSVVVALMQHQSARPVRTFSIGFDYADVNEAVFARAVAEHLGTSHTDLYVRSADALAVIPKLPSMYDEPLGDSSQIPTYLVAQLARRHVTVSLSGDGGDELFYGYQKYAVGQRFSGMLGREAIGTAVGALPWATIEEAASRLPGAVAKRLTAARFRTFHRYLTGKPQHVAEAVAEIFHEPGQLVRGYVSRPTAFSPDRPAVLESSFQRMAMLLDRETYLPDDVLTKVDRATMAVSLESRAPFLDHRIAEYAARLPLDFLVRGDCTKRILRDLLYRRVPRELVDRPKAGFSIPIAQWLRTELNSWARDLLLSGKCNDLLDLKRCRLLFEAHARGERDLSAVSWALLGFLAWAEEWL